MCRYIYIYIYIGTLGLLIHVLLYSQRVDLFGYASVYACTYYSRREHENPSGVSLLRSVRLTCSALYCSVACSSLAGCCLATNADPVPAHCDKGICMCLYMCVYVCEGPTQRTRQVIKHQVLDKPEL